MTTQDEDDLDTQAEPLRIAWLVWAGLGVGALLGLALARRLARQNQGEMIESVEELKARTQKVLNELSQNVAELIDHTRAQMEHAVEAGKDFAALQVTTLDEAIGPSPDEA